ncbi:MAG: AAA family ATPase [Chitinispirillales bacterium]|jgi:hypothetical protein|nr:AAA family ATPase [Chitinispirillales bacterium]
MELKDIERYIPPVKLLYAECQLADALQGGSRSRVCRIIKTDSGGICVRPDGADAAPVLVRFKKTSEEKAVSASLENGGTIGVVKLSDNGVLHEFHFLPCEKSGIKGVTVSDDFLAGAKSGLDGLSSEFVFSVGGGNIVVMARKRLAGYDESMRNDSFVFVGVDRKGGGVTLDCAVTGDDEDNPYINAVTRRPLRNGGDYEYKIMSVETGWLFTKKREILRKSVRRDINGRNNTYLELWREYCFSDYERIIDACVNAGVLKTGDYDDGFIVKDGGTNVLSDFISEMDKTGIDDCYLLPAQNDGAVVGKMNEFRDRLEGQSREDKGKLVSEVREYLRKNGKNTINVDIAASKEKGKIVLQKDQEIGRNMIENTAYILVSGRKKTRMLDTIEREYARIMEGETPMPQLSEILLGINAENEIRYRGARNKNIPLKDMGKYFAYPPTPNQAEALRVAYETPDIAVILGPPGTGKSGLIRAIIKAIEGRDKPLNGTLLTAYQHDALDNLMEHATVNGLPCIRYGGKDKNAAKILSLPLACQIREKAEELTAKYPKYAEKGVLYTIKERIAALDHMQLSFNNVRSYIDGIIDLVKNYMPESLRKLRDLRDKYAAKTNVKEHIIQVASAANRLRCGKTAYEDDGKLCFQTVKDYLDTFGLLKDDKIKKALDGYKADVEDGKFDSALKHRSRLVAEITADKKPVINKSEKQNLRETLRGMLGEIEDRLAQSYNLEAEIISDYIHTYKNNYGETLYAIKKYNKYVGSTHHQLDGNWGNMDFRGSGEEAGAAEFENVIVDEAARSSPNDLAVVISRASKRVVLVGDHHQLPQFQDKKLFEEAMKKVKEKSGALPQTDDGADTDVDADCSLFEKLINVAKRMEERDGIRRFVMLSEQFRSPPLLGSFVSAEFYNGKLENGKKDTKEFEHNIPKYKNVCAVFKELPVKYGFEKKNNKNSRYRPCEAEWIAGDVKDAIDTCGKRLSIGIISFYKAQREYMEGKLVENDSMVRGEDDVASIAPKYANCGHTLFIGTVDAFQGKEFDVVYLSVTVANDAGNIGFLDNENRRCVALSREKKLLIVVGAPEMLKDMGQIKLFRELCKEKPGGRLLP